MMTRNLTLTVLLMLFSLGAADAQVVQPSGTRIAFDMVSVVPSVTVIDTWERQENAEPSSIKATYPVASRRGVSVAAQQQVTGPLWIRGSLRRISATNPITLEASLSHPLYFGKHRWLSAQLPEGTRTEQAFAVQIGFVRAVTSRVEVAVFGGPEFLSVTQATLSDFSYAEEYPYDTTRLQQAFVAKQRASKVTVGAGIDVGYYFSRQVGVGGSLNVSGGSVSLPGLGGAPQIFKTGGASLGAGLRMRF